MAIIVDKVQKRKDIALSCKEIFFQNGIHDLTISQIAKTAGVGKGTIYEYFKNKEDIIFEIVNILIQERNMVVAQQLSEVDSTKEKLKLFSRFFYTQEDVEIRQLYKEFISISLTNPDSEMIEFQSACTNDYYRWFEQLIEDGVKNGELKEGSEKFSRGLFALSEGVFIKAQVTNLYSNIEKEIHSFLDALFELIEVKR